VRCLEADDELIFGWKLNRQVARFVALEDSIDVIGGAATQD